MGSMIAFLALLVIAIAIVSLAKGTGRNQTINNNDMIHNPADGIMNNGIPFGEGIFQGEMDESSCECGDNSGCDSGSDCGSDGSCDCGGDCGGTD